jgi:hypothetical protein
MPKLRKMVGALSRFEEATLGRIISPKGMMFMGGVAVFGEMMHRISEAHHDRKTRHEDRIQQTMERQEQQDPFLHETHEQGEGDYAMTGHGLIERTDDDR